MIPKGARHLGSGSSLGRGGSVMGLCALLVLFFAGLGDCVHAEDAPNTVGENDAKRIVMEAARICRSTASPVLPEISEQGSYLTCVKPLVGAGDGVLAHLRALAASTTLSAFEKRLAVIVATRIREPKLFDAVVPFCIAEKYVDPYEKYSPFRPHVKTNGRLRLKPYTAELIHPDDRERWLACEKLADEIGQIRAKYYARLQALPEGSYDQGQALYSEMNQAVVVKDREYRIKYRELFPKGHRFNPDYLLGWEEAMVRPLPWRLKRELAHIVSRIGDAASIPSLGAVLRSGYAARPDTSTEDYDILMMSHEVTEAIALWPGKAALLEFSDVISSAEGNGKLAAQQEIGWRVSELPGWLQYLKEASRDAELKPKALLIYEAIDKFKESEESRATPQSPVGN